MNKSFNDALFNQDNAFYAEIKSDSESETSARFNVYRNNVFVSLMDALADIFPVTQQLVGEDFFRAMAREYIPLNPPKTPVISDYGDEFSNYVRYFEPAKSLPFLADLAALEFNLLALTNAQEYKALEHEQISDAFNNASNAEQLGLFLLPNTQVLVSPFAIGSIYLAHQGTEKPSLADLDIDRSEYLLLSKPSLYAELHIISESEAIFIKHLMQGKPLAEAIPDHDDFDLGTSLAKLIEWKLIMRISEENA